MHFPVRFAAVVGSREQLREALTTRIPEGGAPQPTGQRRLAFLFSGQASQYARMGAELYTEQPVFRAEVDRCCEIVGSQLGKPLRDILLDDHADASLVNETGYTQPALFAVQAGLVALWRSWGVVPDVLLGHSVGEFAAAYCAGVYTLEQALRLVIERARLMQALPRDGGMAAIFSDAETVAEALEQFGRADVAIAALNGPANTVVSGAHEGVASLIAHFESVRIRCQPLTVSHAFHSPLMRPAANEFRRIAATVQGQPPKSMWISTVSAAPMQEPPGAKYWHDHALNAVRFADGMRALGETGVSDIVEIGPGGALLALGRENVQAGDTAWLASLSTRGEMKEILSSLSTLYRRGFDIDWGEFNRPSRRRLVPMPTYPFERRRFWIEPETVSRSKGPRTNGLTGVRLRSAIPGTQFESTYSLEHFPYLDDHRIYGLPVLPTTVGLTALRDAAREHFGSDTIEIANLQYREAMILPEGGERIVQSIIAPLDDSAAEFRFASIGANGDDIWRTHMVGVVRKENSARSGPAAPLELEAIRQRCATSIPTASYYETLRASGLEYGPSFRGIEMLRQGTGELLTRVQLPAHLSDDNLTGLHPALLDACLHLYAALIEGYGDFFQAPRELRHTYLPIGIERFRCTGEGARHVWVHGVRRPPGDRNPKIITVDISVYQDDGRFAAAIEGLALKQLPPESLGPRASAGMVGTVRETLQVGADIGSTTRASNTVPAGLRLTEAPTAKRRELLIGFVRREAMKTLGITETIDSDRPLGELGLDSLMSVTLVNRLETALGIKISTVTLIQGPSIEQLVDELLPALIAIGGEAMPDSVVSSPSERMVATGDDEVWRQPIVVPPKHFQDDWPIAVDPMTDDEVRAATHPGRLEVRQRGLACHGWPATQSSSSVVLLPLRRRRICRLSKMGAVHRSNDRGGGNRAARPSRSHHRNTDRRHERVRRTDRVGDGRAAGSTICVLWPLLGRLDHVRNRAPANAYDRRPSGPFVCLGCAPA